MIALIILFNTALAGGVIMGLADFFSSDDPEPTQDDADKLLSETDLAALQADFLDDLDATTSELDIQDGLLPPEVTIDGEIDGTPQDDSIRLSDDVYLAFAEAGDDVIVGSEQDNVLFGGQGEDALFGEGGWDQLFGESGDDTLVGGSGDDDLILQAGSDLAFGQAGDDYFADDGNIADQTGLVDIMSGGSGDDFFAVTQGVNLVEMGEGADVAYVVPASQAEENTALVITDFNPQEDALVLGVNGDQNNFEDGARLEEIMYSATLIQTALGPATLVQPTATAGSVAGSLNGLYGAVAVLQGITPQDLETATVQAFLVNQDDAGSLALSQYTQTLQS